MKTILAASATALFFSIVACSKDDDKKTETPPVTATVKDSVAATLPASYSTYCAGCHGTKGEGSSGPALAAKVKGDYSSVSGFIAMVRAGKGSMGGIPASSITDADLTKVHTYFKQ